MAQDGSAENPWQVATYADLKKVGTGADNWNLDDYYIQTADIDASASETENSDGGGGYYGFDPIGDDNNKFSGQYDGDGYKISDLYINRSATAYIGLFASITGTVINLKLENFDITGSNYSGTLAGLVSGGTITNCCSTGVAVNGGGTSGGLCGRIQSSSNVTNCYSTGSVVGAANRLGGLTGYITTSTVSKCYSTCSVNSGESSISYVGGFTGTNDNSTIQNCYATGSVYGTGYTAGLVGYNYQATLNYCYSTGSVSGSGSYIGGLSGRDFGGSSTECYWDTETSGQASSADGTGKTTAEMKDIDTFVGNWDMVAIGSYVDETWYIDDGNDYPRLGWEWEEPEEEAETNVLFMFQNFLLA